MNTFILLPRNTTVENFIKQLYNRLIFNRLIDIYFSKDMDF